jgi:hypothetical protein
MERKSVADSWNVLHSTANKALVGSDKEEQEPGGDVGLSFTETMKCFFDQQAAQRKKKNSQRQLTQLLTPKKNTMAISPKKTPFSHS